MEKIMKNSDFSVGENTHYDVFISHRGVNKDEAKIIYDIIVSDHKSAFLSEVDIPERGNSDYIEVIVQAIEQSDLFIIFLQSPEDFKKQWLNKEYRIYFESQNRKNNKVQCIPIIKGFSKEKIHIELASDFHIIDYEDKNFKKLLLNFCNEKKSNLISAYNGTKYFLSSLNNKEYFIDLPLNMLSFFGFPRYSMTGIILNYDLELEKFEKFEDNIHKTCQNKFQKRKWFKKYFSDDIDIQKDDFALQEDELLGVIIQVALNNNGKYLKHIEETLPVIKAEILEHFNSHEPIIIFNLIGPDSNVFADKLISNNYFINADLGFSPNDYEVFVKALTDRWKFVSDLRDFFSGNSRATDNIQGKINNFCGDPIKEIIELARCESLRTNSYEQAFLSKINNRLLINAMQCGYEFKLPLTELLVSFHQKNILNNMISLFTLCLDTKLIDFNTITQWNLINRQFIGLLTKEESTRGNNSGKSFEEKYQFKDSYFKTIIYHKKTYR